MARQASERGTRKTVTSSRIARIVTALQPFVSQGAAWKDVQAVLETFDVSHSDQEFILTALFTKES